MAPQGKGTETLGSDERAPTDPRLLRDVRALLQQQGQQLADYQGVLANALYQQCEALIGIYGTLDIRAPLPQMRGWAISPDFAVVLVSEIMKRKPGLVVELGSGASTIVAGYALEKTTCGSLLSVEHDKAFLVRTQEQVRYHQLEKLVRLVFAPLREVEIDDRSVMWYEQSAIDLPSEIDLLVIDGPPGHIQEGARYPALPIFYEYLSKDAVILLDDAARKDEQAAVSKWLQRYGDLECEHLQCEKGAAVLRRKQKQ